MEIIKYPNPDEWNKLIKRPALDVSSLFGTVQKVLDEVRTQGDEAVKKYGEQLCKKGWNICFFRTIYYICRLR